MSVKKKDIPKLFETTNWKRDFFGGERQHVYAGVMPIFPPCIYGLRLILLVRAWRLGWSSVRQLRSTRTR